MFIGNLIVDIFFGLVIGIYSDNFPEILIFAILYGVIEAISLVLFRKEEFHKFKLLVHRQETKIGYKTKINSNKVWFQFRASVSIFMALIIGILTLLIKGIIL